MTNILQQLMDSILDVVVPGQAVWAQNIERDRVQLEYASGYFNLKVAGTYLNVDRLGLTTFLPVVTGRVTLTNGQEVKTREIVELTSQELPATSPAGYALGSMTLAPSWVFTQSTLEVQLALVVVKRENLTESALSLVGDIVKLTPISAAAAPVLSLAGQAVDVLDKILKLGENKVRLAGKTDWTLGGEHGEPQTLIFVEAPPREYADTSNLQWLSRDNELIWNDPVTGSSSQYRESSWMVVRIEYRPEHGAVREMPLAKAGEAKIAQALALVVDMEADQRWRLAKQVLTTYYAETVVPSLLLTHEDKQVLKDHLIQFARREVVEPVLDQNKTYAAAPAFAPASAGKPADAPHQSAHFVVPNDDSLSFQLDALDEKDVVLALSKPQGVPGQDLRQTS